MTDFKAKTHQIRFRLGLGPRPRWGAYSSPRLPSWIFGPLRGRGKGWAGEEEGKRRKRGGREKEGPQAGWYLRQKPVGEVRQVVSPTLSFPISLSSPFPFRLSFQTNQWEGRSDPVRGKFPGFPPTYTVFHKNTTRYLIAHNFGKC